MRSRCFPQITKPACSLCDVRQASPLPLSLWHYTNNLTWVTACKINQAPPCCCLYRDHTCGQEQVLTASWSSSQPSNIIPEIKREVFHSWHFYKLRHRLSFSQTLHCSFTWIWEWGILLFETFPAAALHETSRLQTLMEKKKNRNRSEVLRPYNKQLSLYFQIRQRLVIVALKMSDWRSYVRRGEQTKFFNTDE